MIESAAAVPPKPDDHGRTVLVTLTAWEQSHEFSTERREEIQTLRRCVELEARLIDDLLDLTRIIRGKLALNFENVDVHGLLDSVARMYRSDLDAKSIRLSIHLEAPLHYASADPWNGRLWFVSFESGYSLTIDTAPN